MMRSYFSAARGLLFLIAAVVMLIASGCASPNYVWYQQGKDRTMFAKDKLECEEESALYAKQLDKRGNEEVISARMKECMGLRGYVKVLEQDVPQGMEKF
ncbi:MAG: YgdI/YgdR family lipoprotein [Trichlorobacter sp.]|uniref:hypothetical protein n=1 Tax=Trichlorobacter sp. TaxID=2911007 RepID=UPI002569B7DA|nr:hypothetical protein [Trichlorobacter sp.]MDK9718556.1 YgdI/YgdR family lipoprotein [Trichlorobacter sp.]